MAYPLPTNIKGLQYHCRICLGKLLDKVYNKEIKTLSQWIKNFSSINVRAESPDYPKYVCSDCFNIFKDLHSFKQLIQRTEKSLVEFFEDLEVCQSSTDIHNGLKRKTSCEQVQQCKRGVTISDTEETNSNRVQLKSIDSLLTKSNSKHSIDVADMKNSAVIKSETSHDDLNEIDNKGNNTSITESNRSEFLTSELNGPNLEELIIKSEIYIDDSDNDSTSNEFNQPYESNLEYMIQISDENIDKIAVKTEPPIENEDDNISYANAEKEILDTESEVLDDGYIHDLTDYKCEKCNLHYDNKFICLAHKRLTHEGKRKNMGFKCEICSDSYFLTFLHLDRHNRDVHNIFVRPYKCAYESCHFRFRDWSERIKHYHDYHEQIKATRITDSTEVLEFEKDLFICIVCNRQFKYLIDIKYHMPIHGDDVKFFCGICGDRYCSQKELDYHYRANHTVRSMWYGYKFAPCRICKRMFPL